jgi:hypothetical protein
VPNSCHSLSEEEVLVDRPKADNKITRVTGPLGVEGAIPKPTDWEGTAGKAGRADTV